MKADRELSRLGILLPVALVSCGVLSYEILLARLFAIIQWHHFAYMVISIALLGFGASGALLSFAGNAFTRRFKTVFCINAALFSVTSVASFLVAQQAEFNPLELAWGFEQSGKLLLIYLALLIPFLFAANAIGLALMVFSNAAARVYAWDLVGAGAGAAGIVAVLFLISADNALLIPAMLGVAAASMSISKRPLAALGISLCAAGAVIALFALILEQPLRLRMSQFKALEQALQVAGAKLGVERNSPLARLSVVENQTIPLRYAPGLSLLTLSRIPEQAALFIDGDGPAAINRFDGSRESISFVDQLTSALPYQFTKAPSVLVVGLNGGGDVLQAIYYGATEIDVVELNPQVVEIVKETYADFSGRILQRKEVRVFIEEARGYAERASARYDLVQVGLSGSLVAFGSGLKALAPGHLYTVEGVRALFELLKPGGVLAFTSWERLPPRDGIKLFATAVSALEAAGVRDPGRQLAWIRSFNTSTLLVKNGAIGLSEASTLRAFANHRGFDTAYYPGIRAVEANRFNQLEENYFYEAAQALLSDQSDGFLQHYKFDIEPASDDRPYFSNFFKAGSAAEMLALKDRGGMGLLDLGYLVVWATLFQALVLSALLILVPLIFFYRGEESNIRKTSVAAATLIYFLSIGLGFIFIEIMIIDKFLLFLSHPLYAVAVVLAGMLVFAGLGSSFAMRRAGRPVKWRILLPVIAIIFIGGVYLQIFPRLSGTLVMLPDTLSVSSALLLIAPLAFFMGMPFPVAIEALSRKDPALIPWAWGANGCASVVGAVLAALMAAGYGGSTVIALGLALYLAAGALAVIAFATPVIQRDREA